MFRLPDDPRKLSLWTRAMTLAACCAMILLTSALVGIFPAVNRPALNADPERINPNTASLASLMRLPGIGTARAADIIHYRDSSGDSQPAFHSLVELQNVPGIGPVTAEAMAPYLTFETNGKTK